uniref:Uncharacterized protein n=1 Tax=Neobodo designis TaxID=312471 RepID=A0A7S1M9T8_NEODS|mmetsp:Transcript_36802/g.113554  ORF Transcript_36802/g.113554 Transcript_36802/m.113554 type:complete len:187 (+) Transcript_36802:137-697(+)
MTNCSTAASPCSRNQICCDWLTAPDASDSIFCCERGYECGDAGTCRAALEGRAQAFEMGIIFLIVLAVIVVLVCIVSLVWQCTRDKKAQPASRAARTYRAADGQEIESPEATGVTRPATAPQGAGERDAVQIQHSALRMDSISDEEMQRRDREAHRDVEARRGVPVQSPPRTEFSEAYDADGQHAV